ncbi:MAG: VCBS repeat-containing protein, partial [Bacteroidota bacterium]
MGPRTLAICLGVALLMGGCETQEGSSSITQGPLFTSISPEKSQVTFANQITESDTLNYFSFPYLYLGGGVAVGDINNDGLPDLYFTGNQVSNKLYLNQGDFTFEDITLKAGVAGDSRWYSGATMVDINQDGWLDLYLSVSGKFGSTANQLFINQGDNTFTEEAEAYGIADESISIQSTFFDYNQDGFLDLFVANYPVVRVTAGNQYYKDKIDQNRWEDSGHLYENLGDGTFKDVTDSAGLRRFGLTLGLVASDFNQDGWTDLYLSNDFNVPDYLYQNNGDGTFSEISQTATRHTSMFGMGIDAGDFNNDGWIDLVQLDMTAEDHKRSKTNMASMNPKVFYEALDFGFHYQYMQNSLQLNQGISAQGKPIFSDLSRMAGMATTDWSWGVLFADLDNDGWKDVFISNGVKRDVNNNDANQQYENASFFGRDPNPDVTLLPSTPIANYAFQNQGDLTFENVTKAWGLAEAGFSNGFVTTDLDQDGDLDLVINNLDAPASIYVNESQDLGNHFLKIRCLGPESNPLGIGTKVSVKTALREQTQELTLTRGYQSSLEPRLHFGLGPEDRVEVVRITWPDGKIQEIKGVRAGQTMEVDIREAQSGLDRGISTYVSGAYEEFEPAGAIFQHHENTYDDFRLEPLLPHKNSQIGPALAVGDVNQDGLEDVFIGNAEGQKSALMIQDQAGHFQLMPGPWEADSLQEATGALLFDADQDGDLDLYVAHGGYDPQKPADFYQDALYVNPAQGFQRVEAALPSLPTSSASVASGDVDGDGDLDLFVGGRIVPGKYPYPAASHVLRNQGGRDLDLRFQDVTAALAPDLKEAGLVTAALWDDFDQDGQLDLILTGEWMPIRFFRNTGGRLQEVTKDLGVADEVGWWYSLAKADLDGDGDPDYLAGNLGLNYKYRASEEKPFEVYANDFDENGRTDIVLSYKKYGTLVPLRGRECSSEQVPAIKQRFKTYELFANANLADIYGQSMLDQSLHYAATNFAHGWLENLGPDGFRFHPLPKAAQVSSGNASHVLDYNQDA